MAFTPPSRSELRFSPFVPAPDITFWQELTRRKLDVFRLDASAVAVEGFYEPRAGDKCFLIPASFETAPQFPASSTRVRGQLKNFNTVEEFKKYMTSEARSESVAVACMALRDDIVNGIALEDPGRLRPFLLVVFADLKKYVFSYTLSFPVLSPHGLWPLLAEPLRCDSAPLGLGRERLIEFASLLLEEPSLLEAGAFVLLRRESERTTAWCLLPLKAIATDEVKKAAPENVVVAFVDPTSSDDTFGWPLRNIILLIAFHLPGPRYFLSFRDVYLGSKGADAPVQSRILFLDASVEAAKVVLTAPPPGEARFAGWSKIQSIDLTAFLDKRRMAADAVDLNVKLMKWRILPDLEPGRLKDLRVLLLGAGTLGCSVARVLMGWGVRRMTFVDSGKVGLSNPVRQSLFTHEDAAANRSKAVAARDAVLAVMPDAEVVAVEMEIPMPGHPLQSRDHLEQLVQRLQDLVDAHDVVCMLTDSRESRWLPSLLVSARQVNVPSSRQPPLGITVALGFDSFLVSRQSFRSSKSACYFCNDLTAPTDSLAFRTLDQQCTVTRPGLSFLSAGAAVELIVALTQHPDGFGASCSLAPGEAGTASLLGAVPHQIRGYLAGFRLAPVETEPFTQCICCSDPILERFAAEGSDFLHRVVANSKELEQVSGLADMKAAVREDEVIAFDDDFDE